MQIGLNIIFTILSQPNSIRIIYIHLISKMCDATFIDSQSFLCIEWNWPLRLQEKKKKLVLQRLSNLDGLLDQRHCLSHLGNHQLVKSRFFLLPFHHTPSLSPPKWIKAKNRRSGKKCFVRFVVCATQFSYKVAAVGRISISRSRASEMDRSTKIFLLSFALLIWVNIFSFWSLRFLCKWIKKKKNGILKSARTKLWSCSGKKIVGRLCST